MCAQWTWYKYDVTFIWHGCDFMSVCIFPLVSTCFFLSLFVLFSVWFYDFTSHFLCLILNFTFSFVHFTSIQWNFFSVRLFPFLFCLGKCFCWLLQWQFKLTEIQSCLFLSMCFKMHANALFVFSLSFFCSNYFTAISVCNRWQLRYKQIYTKLLCKH